MSCDGRRSGAGSGHKGQSASMACCASRSLESSEQLVVRMRLQGLALVCEQAPEFGVPGVGDNLLAPSVSFLAAPRQSRIVSVWCKVAVRIAKMSKSDFREYAATCLHAKFTPLLGHPLNETDWCGGNLEETLWKMRCGTFACSVAVSSMAFYEGERTWISEGTYAKFIRASEVKSMVEILKVLSRKAPGVELTSFDAGILDLCAAADILTFPRHVRERLGVVEERAIEALSVKLREKHESWNYGMRRWAVRSLERMWDCSQLRTDRLAQQAIEALCPLCPLPAFGRRPSQDMSEQTENETGTEHARV